MAAVRAQQAPTDPTCEPDVANANRGVATFDAGTAWLDSLRSSAQSGDDAVYLDFTCPALSIENRFTAPLRMWGYYYKADENEHIFAMRGMVTRVIPPGERQFDTADFDPFDGCGWNGGFLAAGDGPNPIARPNSGPADDPQASDDPAIWFPVVQQHLNAGRESGSIDYLIDNAYDLHSLDLQRTIGQDGKVVVPATLNYCGYARLQMPPDAEVEWVMLLLSGNPGFQGNEDGLYLGLFSRGTDRRWRIVGEGAKIGVRYDPANPCASPAMI